MAADSDFLKTLQDKEAELLAKLEENPIYKQIVGIRSTIELFRSAENSNGNGHAITTTTPPIRNVRTLIPVYRAEGTWESKILFALDEITSGFVEDIIAVMRREEPTLDMDDESLYKRVSQNCSVLKSNSKIDGVKNGLKVKYYKK